ncbi:MAG TPA: hypothetical protein VF796_14610 [Humisphaera sp.]
MTFVDTLESRSLMSVSLDPASHVLTITGKDDFAAGDNIVVTVENSKLKVVDNGVAKLFDPAAVAKIKVLARSGPDLVNISTLVTKPTEIDTGAGGPLGTRDTVYGGSGKDVVNIRSAFASVSTRNGDDTVTDFEGFALINTGANNDTVFLKSGGESTVDGGDGTDTVDASSYTTGMLLRNGKSGQYIAGTAGSTGIPTINGAGTTFSLAGFENFTGTQGNDYIHGTDGRNVLKGLAGNDWINAFGGDDEVYGGAGNDRLYGGTGKNALFGGDGDDTLYALNGGAADFLSGGNGTDRGYWEVSDTVTGVEVKL